jgi:hypothetical protein
MVATHRRIGSIAAGLQSLARRIGRDKRIAPIADKVGSPGFEQCLADFKPVVGLEELQ